MDLEQLKLLAPAAVPFVLFLTKLLVDKGLPDFLVVRIRDYWIPLLAPFAGVLVDMARTGQVDWSQGAVIGLAGVGIHQAVKQILERFGYSLKTGAVLRTE